MKRLNSGDRISSLPDSILCLILSLMPTLNAVATSVLSKRWKSLWKSVHNFDFILDFCRCGSNRLCSDDCGEEEGSTDKIVKFTKFVNNVLLLHDDGFLNKFRLVWQPICIPVQVICWTTFAITSNVQELCLCVNKYDKPFEIPSTLFGCQTLKSLELNGNMFVSDSIAVSLPRLERLKLVSFYFLSDLAFQKVISGCPVLDDMYVLIDMNIMIEDLEIYQDNQPNLFTFRISSTSLTSLSLYVEFDPELFEALPPYCSLVLEGPSLVYLHLVGYVPRIFVRESLSSLVEADISITLSEILEASINNRLVEAVGALNGARSIRLSESVISALSLNTIGFSTKFKKLTELSAGANCCYCGSIQAFIEFSENLQVLRVDKMVDCSDSNNSHTFPNWTTPRQVPRCLSKCLKTVQFDGFGGFAYEFNMIRYMLKHGSALEVMTIHSDLANDDERLKLVEKICSFPRKSPHCCVKFNWYNFN